MTLTDAQWYRFSNVAEVPSPALVVYPDRVAENLRRMIATVGQLDRLRPHVKTHKMAEILRMNLRLGINRFKAATLAETEMCAAHGAPDVLWAYPPVGPHPALLLELMRRYPATRFSTLVDHPEAARALSDLAQKNLTRFEVLLDIDCGQHRTGLPPGPDAAALYALIQKLPGLRAGGLHVYDGHIHDSDPMQRRAACDAAFAPVAVLVQELTRAAGPLPRLVAGGTPTFPFHAAVPDRECSPGTCVLWDAGYATRMPDLDFLCAAMVLARVVSKPGQNRLCLDLGHKAIASENPHPRVIFPDLPQATATGHSEEHLVIDTPDADKFRPGDVLYGIPWHICPTVALHGEALVVRNGQATGTWKIDARNRTLAR